MKQLVFTIIALHLIANAFGQQLRPKIQKLVRKMETQSELHSKHVGITGETTDLYKTFEKLSQKARIDELLTVFNHDNNVVKGYASWALVDKKYPQLVDLFIDLIQSSKTVIGFNGCMKSEEDLAVEFYHRALFQGLYHPLSLKDNRFFRTQLQQLDSVILYDTKNNIEPLLLDYALSNNFDSLKNYDRIKQLAFVERNEDAIRALAAYQRKSDIEYFKNLNEQAFVAIPIFPDNEFWGFLYSYKDTNTSRNYIMAVAAFQTETAAEVLSEILPKIKEKEIENFADVITKYYCPDYQTLALTVWEQHNYINAKLAMHFVNEIPERAANAFVVGLLSNNELKFPTHDYSESSRILQMMLDNIKVYQSDRLIDICKHNIKTAKFYDLAVLLDYVKLNGFNETQPDIFDRLQQKNQAYDIFNLTKTILSFNNFEDRPKLIASLKRNKKDWDWGNWSSSFMELFMKYGIQFD